MKERAEELAHLVALLQDTELRIVELTGGEVDAVLLPSGEARLLEGAQRDLQGSETQHRVLAGLLSSLLDALPAHVALVARDGRVLSVNAAWERFAAQNGGTGTSVGADYLAVCDRAGGPGGEEAGQAAAGLRAVLEGRFQRFELEYSCDSPQEARWFRMTAAPTPEGAVVMHMDVTQRRLAEEDLRRSERRHRILFQSHPHPMWLFDPESLQFLDVNEAAIRHYGYSRAEFLSMTLRDIRPPEDVPALLRGLVTTGDHMHRVGVWRHRLRDGRIRQVEISAQPLDLEGRPATLVLAVDVTEQAQAQEALRASEERFRVVSRATNDVLWEWDLASGHMWWSERFGTTFGYLADEVPPTFEAWTALVHDEDRPRFRSRLREVLDRSQSHWSEEYRFRRRNGSYAYVRDRGHVLRGSEGRPLRMVGGLTDVSERRKAERRLAEQAALIDQASDAIVVRDLQHRVLFWSRGATVLYGWTPEEAVGREVWELHAGPEIPTAIWEEFRSKGEWSGELTHRTRTGEVVVVFAHWTLLRDAFGQAEAVLALSTDITERRKLQEQLLRVQRMESIGVLAGGIAHDLNNVLAPVMMAVEMLQEEVGTAEGLSLVETLRASSLRGADLIRQILTFARGQEGPHEAVDVVEVARDLKRLVQETFPPTVTFGIECGERPWPVLGDPTQIHQVLMSLCVNARDAMPLGGRLTVSVENVVLDEVYAKLNPLSRPGPHLLITVEDTGTGIPADLRERIFEPFFTTKEPGRGTGLGLSTCFTIVRNHGGFIDLYSEAGKGTRFKVYLPALATEAQARTEVAQRQPLPRGRGELVLVVDDESAIREVARAALERYGYRVLLAGHGAEAVSQYALHRGEVAVVLTDMSMPVMDGPALAIALRSLDPDVRIVGSSGLALNASMARAVGAGLLDFVHKPYTAEALLTTLDRVLRTEAALTPPEPAPRRPSADRHEGPAAGSILVVDDEASLRNLMVRALSAEGYHVLSASGFQEALALLDGHGPVDLVLTDIQLAGEDGRELARRIQDEHPCTRIAFASGSPGTGEPGGLPLLAKPFTLEQLKSRVRDLLLAPSPGARLPM